MARIKVGTPVFPNNKLSQNRLDMLRHVFPECSSEEILAKALDMFWKQHEQQVNDFVKSLSSYATYESSSENNDAAKQ